MGSSLDEIGVAKVARCLQKMGWLVGKSYDAAYDLLAYSPKHYRVCNIAVVSFDLTGPSRNAEISRILDSRVIKGCTHIVVYIEPASWYYVSTKEEILQQEGKISAVLDNRGNCPDKGKNGKSFALFKDQWERLLK